MNEVATQEAGNPTAPTEVKEDNKPVDVSDEAQKAITKELEAQGIKQEDLENNARAAEAEENGEEPKEEATAETKEEAKPAPKSVDEAFATAKELEIREGEKRKVPSKLLTKDGKLDEVKLFDSYVNGEKEWTAPIPDDWKPEGVDMEGFTDAQKETFEQDLKSVTDVLKHGKVGKKQAEAIVKLQYEQYKQDVEAAKKTNDELFKDAGGAEKYNSKVAGIAEWLKKETNGNTEVMELAKDMVTSKAGLAILELVKANAGPPQTNNASGDLPVTSITEAEVNDILYQTSKPGVSLADHPRYKDVMAFQARQEV